MQKSSKLPGERLMVSIPREQTPAAQPAETVEERFRRLEAIWTMETGYLSSDQEITGHPAFQEIIRLGNDVVPLMLQDLCERPRLWVWALPQITGVNPVPPSDRGHIAKMSDAWLRWGRANGYRC
jgi:hypothetical protein